MTARQRLRRATEESLTVPTFSAPLDCTPWVIGGLWPVELSQSRNETATLAKYLKSDLQRIAATANEELRGIGQAGMVYTARRAAEARVIEEARALAVRRVESTLRQLRQSTAQQAPVQPPPEVRPAPRPDLAKTQVLPVIRDEPFDIGDTQVLPAVQDEVPAQDVDATQVLPAVVDDGPPAEPPPDPEAAPPADAAPEDAEPTTAERLPLLLAFVARQEPRLSWAVGEHEDGTTVLVTDLAHGWIPPGIAVPEGVRLLEPGTRTGRAAELLGNTIQAATYAPGDSSKLSVGLSGVAASVQPKELPPVTDLGWELGVATHWRQGLPRLVNTLAKAAAAGADVVDQELDLLRVHLDTTRYQLLAQYPDVDPEQLLNCMLLAATESSATGDVTSANYHFAWFQKLADRAPGRPAQS